MRPQISIEPARGETYDMPGYGVYEYGEYGRDSVLAGQDRRVLHGIFPTLPDAVRAVREQFPNAELSIADD